MELSSSSSPLWVLWGLFCCAVQVLGLVQAQQQQQPMMLTSLPYYNDVRRQATNVTRKGNVDVVQMNNFVDGIELKYDDDDVGRDDVGFEELAFCHLPALIPLARAGIGDIAGIALAIQHLNSGNGTIVPEIEGINKRCNIRFTFEVSDTEDSVRGTVNNIIHLIYRDLEKKGDTEHSKPCAFLGAYRSDNTVPASIISSVNNYPMFSPSATSSVLDNKQQFDHFGRLIPSDDGTALALVQFLLDLDVYHFVVLHVDDVYGNRYLASLREAANKIAPGKMKIKPFSIPTVFETNPERAQEIIESRIKDIAETQLLYIVGIFYVPQYKTVMKEAFQQGIAGNGVHNWLFGDVIMNTQIRDAEYEKGSPLYLATKGIGIISFSSQYTPYYKKYVAALQELDNNEDLDYLKSTLPIDYDDDWVFPIDYSETSMQSPILYDTVIAYGLAACEAANNNFYSKNMNNIENDYFTGTELFNKMLQTDFEGVSGKVKLDNESGTRLASTAVYTITNLVVNNSSEDDLVATFSSQVTHVFQDSKWINTEYQYIYNDGTTEIPPSLPSAAALDQHHLSLALKRLCKSMGALIMIASIGLGIWTYINKNHRVIRASQPLFLNCLLVGTFLMGSSIIPLTIDDQNTSQNGCVIACTIYPWLLMIGLSLAFTALLTKTKRINQILNKKKRFSRITVTAYDVLPTMIIFVSANILILSLWTGLSPMGWVRTDIDFDMFQRTIETSSECSYNNSTPYVIALVVVNLCALFYTVYEAYRARELSTEFQETGYITKALVCMMLVCFVGLPISIISKENDTRMYLSVGIIFVVCMSLLGFIFVPKIWFCYKKQSNTETTTGRVHISTYPAMATIVVSNHGMSVRSSEFNRVNTNQDNENSSGVLAVHQSSVMTNIAKEYNNLVEENKRLRELLELPASERSEESFIQPMPDCSSTYSSNNNNEDIDVF